MTQEKQKQNSTQYRNHPKAPCNQPFNIFKKKEEKNETK